MKSIWLWRPLRCIAALALSCMAMLALPASSGAATYTLSFTGNVTTESPSFGIVGIAIGDPISGSLTYSALNATANVTDHVSFGRFLENPASFTFHVNHPGGLHLTVSDTGT